MFYYRITLNYMNSLFKYSNTTESLSRKCVLGFICMYVSMYVCAHAHSRPILVIGAADIWLLFASLLLYRYIEHCTHICKEVHSVRRHTAYQIGINKQCGAIYRY